MLVDLAARCWSAERRFSRSGLSVSMEMLRAGEKVLLLKPQTFMNRSGLAVREALARYAGDQPQLLVAYDDFHLPLGKLRLRERGSSGGHHGMESIIECLGSEEFLRLRLGIADERLGPEAQDFVLDPFPAAAEEQVKEMLDKGVQALESIMSVGPTKTMSIFN
jgi:PTH1 family peptidyl-tRNA hydrolase